MRLSVMLAVIVLMALTAQAVMAQAAPPPAPPGAGPGPAAGPRDGGGRAMMGGAMGGMMSAPPVVVATDKYVYVVFAGQISMFNAETLDLIKSTPLPMPMGGMGGRPARDGRRGDAGAAGGGGAPPPPPPPPAQ